MHHHPPETNLRRNQIAYIVCCFCWQKTQCNLASKNQILLEFSTTVSGLIKATKSIKSFSLVLLLTVLQNVKKSPIQWFTFVDGYVMAFSSLMRMNRSTPKPEWEKLCRETTRYPNTHKMQLLVLIIFDCQIFIKSEYIAVKKISYLSIHTFESMWINDVLLISFLYNWMKIFLACKARQ